MVFYMYIYTYIYIYTRVDLYIYMHSFSGFEQMVFESFYYFCLLASCKCFSNNLIDFFVTFNDFL